MGSCGNTKKDPSGKEFSQMITEGDIKVCTWLREICSCSCLTVLSGPAWVLLSKKNKPLFPPLYIILNFSRQPIKITDKNPGQIHFYLNDGGVSNMVLLP